MSYWDFMMLPEQLLYVHLLGSDPSKPQTVKEFMEDPWWEGHAGDAIRELKKWKMINIGEGGVVTLSGEDDTVFWNTMQEQRGFLVKMEATGGVIETKDSEGNVIDTRWKTKEVQD